MMRFPRYDLELTRIDPELTLFRPLPDWSPDGPQIPSRDPQMALSHTAVWNKALLHVLLTVADKIRVSSQDWIAPPTCCQE